jgi:diadenosine tetraphosphate (Ap4A) HIT family hydrolase
MKSLCSFCNIKNSSILYKSRLVYIFYDQHPLTIGHILIVPKRHVDSFFSTTLEEKIELFDGIEKGKSLVESNLKPDGYNIGINDGEAAGQTIKHLHIHLIPRYKGDSPDPRGGIRWIFPDKAKYWEDNE